MPLSKQHTIGDRAGSLAEALRRKAGLMVERLARLHDYPISSDKRGDAADGRLKRRKDLCCGCMCRSDKAQSHAHVTNG